MFSLFNLQGALRNFAACPLISVLSDSITKFLICQELFQNFVIFCRSLSNVSNRSELRYSNIASSVCQEVFSSFFKIFMTRIRNARRSQKRSAIIPNGACFVKHFFHFFSIFSAPCLRWCPVPYFAPISCCSGPEKRAAHRVPPAVGSIYRRSAPYSASSIRP